MAKLLRAENKETAYSFQSWEFTSITPHKSEENDEALLSLSAQKEICELKPFACPRHMCHRRDTPYRQITRRDLSSIKSSVTLWRLTFTRLWCR